MVVCVKQGHTKRYLQVSLDKMLEPSRILLVFIAIWALSDCFPYHPALAPKLSSHQLSNDKKSVCVFCRVACSKTNSLVAITTYYLYILHS